MTFAEHVAFDMVAVCVAKVKKYVRLLVHCESNVFKMLRNHYAKNWLNLYSTKDTGVKWRIHLFEFIEYWLNSRLLSG